MDDTFTFVAPVMPRRRVDPFALKIAVVATLFVAFVGAFGAFVVQREHAADAAREAKGQAVLAAERADIEATAAAAAAAGAGTEAGLADTEARGLLEQTLELARTATTRGALTDAGPVQLAALDPSLLLVDGPSTAPVIVSVAATDASWAAAVMGPSGACYWIRLNADGEVSRDLGGRCTGEAALAAIGDTW
jgi:hypothetical protein